MPLSKGDVAQALIVMRRFDRFIEADDLAVESWYLLLEPEIPNAIALRDAILTVFRREESRVTAAHIINCARELERERFEQLSPELQQREIVNRQRRAGLALLAKAGVTEAEFNARVKADDREWLDEHFAEPFYLPPALTEVV